MTVICIHQPDFLPWLGYFERLIRSDIFVVLDDVQYLRRGWQNRDRIKTDTGTDWLTVPVRKKGRYHQLISDVEIDHSRDWRRKHLSKLRAAYRDTAYFESVFDRLSQIYSQKHELLIELNMDLIGFLTEMLGISVKTILSSELGVEGRSNAMLAEITKHVGGDTYLTGIGAREYLDEEVFAAQGISVQWQKFEHPVYEQPHGAFIPKLSGVDCLFNCGQACGSMLAPER